MTSVLRYPYEALTETTDYLQLTIKKYPGISSGNADPIAGASFGTNQSAIDVSNTAASALKPAQLSEDGVIILPMPSNIEDSNSVSYDGDTLNGLAAAAFDVASIATGSNLLDVKALKDNITEIGTKMNTLLKDEGGNIRSIATKALAAQAVNLFGSNISINSILARTQGKILNPNMELLFNNVTLRTFRFSFKMTPRDEVESLQVKSIIRSLKKNMAARKVGTLFLETPNIFELEYKKGNKLHPFLHRFKQCALSDMSVNYTGENVYATYNDGTPVSLIMNLTFKELVPIYEDDYYDDAFTVDDKGNRTADKDYENGIPQDRMVYGITGTRAAGNAQQNNVEGVGY